MMRAPNLAIAATRYSLTPFAQRLQLLRLPCTLVAMDRVLPIKTP
jgi:hypothetical protein